MMRRNMRRLALAVSIVGAAAFAVFIMLDLFASGNQQALASGEPQIEQIVNGVIVDLGSEVYVNHGEEVSLGTRLKSVSGIEITSASVIPTDTNFITKSQSSNVNYYPDFLLGGETAAAVVYQGTPQSNPLNYSFKVIGPTADSEIDLPVQKSPSNVYLMHGDSNEPSTSSVTLVFLPKPIVTFTVTPIQTFVGHPTNFVGHSNQDDYIDKWIWTIGEDKRIEDSQYISSTFQEIGDVKVSLQATNNANVQSDIYSVPVKVISATTYIPLVSVPVLEPQECIPERNTSVKDADAEEFELKKGTPTSGKYCADEENKERIYWINPDIAGEVVISLLVPNDADMDLYLYRAKDLELLDSSRRPGFGKDELIKFDVDAGKYYVRVYRFRDQEEDSSFTVEWE